MHCMYFVASFCRYFVYKIFSSCLSKKKKRKKVFEFLFEGWWLRNLGGGVALFCLRKNYLMLHFVYNNLLEKNNRIILVSRSESNKQKRKVLRFYPHSSVQCLVSLPMLKIKRTRGFDPLPSQLLPNELTFMFFICITCLVLYVVVHQVCVQLCFLLHACSMVPLCGFLFVWNFLVQGRFETLEDRPCQEV